MKKINFLSLVIFYVIQLFSLSAHALSATITEIKDTRTTGKFFSGMELELTLVGDEMADVTSKRVIINSAIDETGRDLKDPEEKNSTFQENSKFNLNKISLKLRNPARKATVLKQLTGEIQLYAPKNDAQSIVVIPAAISQSAKQLSSALLQQQGISFTLFNSADYAAFCKAEADKKAAQMGNVLGGVMNQAFTGLLGRGNPNDLTFVIKDPNQRIVDYKLYTSAGEVIDNHGSMSALDYKTLSYSQPTPADAQLKIFVATDKALIKVPLNLSDIALP